MKTFYTFQELADKTNCEPSIIMNLATQGLLAVFIVANNWLAHIWKKPFNEDNLKEDFDFGDATLVTPLEKPIKLNNSLIQLKKSTLAAINLIKLHMWGHLRQGIWFMAQKNLFLNYDFVTLMITANLLKLCLMTMNWL